MRTLTFIAVCALTALTAGCSGTEQISAKMYRMGERVQVGPLIYTILDTEWYDHFGELPNEVIPHQRFLTVRLSVTNSGAATADVPPASLVDSNNSEMHELSEVRGVREWLGYFRSVQPAETLHGRIVFDVPSGPYQLRLSNGDPENPKIALVDMPLQMSPVVLKPKQMAGQ